MSNITSPQYHVNGTVNSGAVNYQNCCPPDIDYTTYIKIGLAIGFFYCMTYISGHMALASSVKSLADAVRDHGPPTFPHLAEPVDAGRHTRSTESFDEYKEHADSEETPPSPSPAKTSNYDGVRASFYPSRPSRSSSASLEKKRGKWWKKVQDAVFSNDGWAMRTVTVAVGCLVGAAPSVQVNLPTPVTEPRRSY